MVRYIFRIDDIHPSLDWENFKKIIELFDNFEIRPLISVIPDNKDKNLVKGKKDKEFWGKIKRLKEKGWDIGMHGYQHIYVNKKGGILGLHKGSEFAELPYREQLDKIEKGKKVLEEEGIFTDIFIAPGHSFDKNTVKAIANSGFNYLSDGFALWPFKKWEILWIPQIAANPRVFPFGIITFCLHPQSLNEEKLKFIELFLKRNSQRVISFSFARKWYKEQTLFLKIMFSLLNVPAGVILSVFRSIKKLC